MTQELLKYVPAIGLYQIPLATLLSSMQDIGCPPSITDTHLYLETKCYKCNYKVPASNLEKIFKKQTHFLKIQEY